MFGRRRLVPDLMSRDFQRRSAAERAAVNMPIQGTAADIMKRAMVDVHEALAGTPQARMILTVHDELVFEVPEAEADRFAGDRARPDAVGRGPEGAAGRGRRHRAQLERRQRLKTAETGKAK